MDRTPPSRLIAVILAAFALAGCSASSPTAAQTLTGAFALIGSTPRVSAQMQVTHEGTQAHLDIVQTASDSGKPARDYVVEHEQIMHIIVIGEDFTSFDHVHPLYDAATGHFTLTVPMTNGRRSFVYTDSEPRGLGQQVFRFVVQPNSATGSPSNSPVPSFTPSPAVSTVGPYAVAFSTTSLKANTPTMMTVSIDHNGKPATDLKPFLGAPAHVVLINTSSLDYAHVHPTLAGASHDAMSDMSGMEMHDEKPTAGPRLMLHIPALPVGSYKTWMQFGGGKAVYAAPFTLVVR